MSLFYRKKSPIFNNASKTSQKLKIQEVLNSHKAKLKINNLTQSKPKRSQIQMLSLAQALKIQNLHQTTASSRKSSLNKLLKGFENNCRDNIEQEFNTISDEGLKLFRTGIYYRNTQTARGARLKAILTDDLKQYFESHESDKEGQKQSQYYILGLDTKRSFKSNRNKSYKY